ncbi:MAG: hypothetical protein IPM37_03700 [Hahellaceae bacterium]|nr:hypothetical protein [Hahellaceae bacterium]
MAYILGSTIQYWNWKKVGDNMTDVNEDPPMKLVKSLMAMPSSLKPLEGVIDAPLVLKDGRLLTTVGYDPESLLYLVSNEIWHIPENPTENQVKSALETLMFPFNNFPFVSTLDRAIFLASLLTAIERPALPAAPAFGFDAPVQGSGKTLLAGCVGALSTGEKVPITPHTAGRDDEETRKRLFSALMGGDKVMLWDNILGVFDSAALAGLLTSDAFKDRVLGQSKESALPNRMLVLLTGNNLCLAGDMPRRTLVARIDPKTDQPFARSFDLDPLDYVLRNRNKMIVAGLTVIQGWLQSSDYMLSITAKGRTASFEVWDDLVRQPVAWVNRVIAPNQYGDPMDAILEAQNSDPEQEALRGFLKSMITTFGKERVTAKKIVEKCSDYSAFSSTNDLKEAIIDMAGSDRLTTKGVGRMMKYRKDRVAGGMVLRMKDRWDGAVWWVERVDAALSVVGGES